MKHLLKKAKITRTKLGDSGQTFLVKYQGQKYILRRCGSKKEADFYILLCKKIKKYGFLPKVINRNNADILFEYVGGRNCKKSDALKVAYRVGRICATVNRIKLHQAFNLDEKVSFNLKTLSEDKVINKARLRELRNFYKNLKKKTKPRAALDANDVNPENFRLSKGKVYFVDIEAIKPRLRGQGIGKAFVRWFKRSEERSRFIKGYASISSIDFLTDAYLKLCYFNFLLQSLGTKLRKRKGLHRKDLERLDILLEGRLE